MRLLTGWHRRARAGGGGALHVSLVGVDSEGSWLGSAEHGHAIVMSFEVLPLFLFVFEVQGLTELTMGSKEGPLLAGSFGYQFGSLHPCVRVLSLTHHACWSSTLLLYHPPALRACIKAA